MPGYVVERLTCVRDIFTLSFYFTGFSRNENPEEATCKESYHNDPAFCLTGWCAKGYTGNTCSECADGYAQSSQSTRTCAICRGNPTYYLKAIGISLAAIIFIAWTIKTSIEIHKKSGDPDAKGAKKEEEQKE